MAQQRNTIMSIEDMERRSFLIALVFTVTFFTGAVESTHHGCPSDDWLYVGTNKCYYIRKNLSDWDQASTFCQNTAPGAHLAIIQSQMETDLLQPHIKIHVWIGLQRNTKTGEFLWLDGSRPVYFNWAWKEPNNLGSNEDCTILQPETHWNDIRCSYNGGAVCEFNKALPCPEPKKESKVLFIEECDNLLPGQECKYTCSDNLTPKNGGKITCLRNRSWNTAIAQCEAIPCPEPRTVNKANLTSDCDQLPPGSVCKFTCTEYLTPRNQGSMTCRANRKWDPPEAECTVVSCPEPRLDPNVVLDVDCAKAAPGSHCTFKCKNDLTPKDGGVLVCKDKGEWHPTVALCQVVPCLEPPEKHEKATFKTNCRGLMSGENCLFSCSDNLTPKNGGKLTCSSHGGFDQLKAECQAIPCPEPAKSASVKFISSCKNVLPNSPCYFTCKNNLTPRFGGQLNCLADGKWNFPQADCDAVLCPEPKRDLRAEFKGNCDFLSPGHLCEFSCPSNFVPRNGGKLVCKAGGIWDIPTAQCLVNITSSSSCRLLLNVIKGKDSDDIPDVNQETNYFVP